MTPPKLLVVEDEIANQKLLRRLLGSSYQLEFAGTVETGWAVLNSDEAIELVLLDLNLPGESGFDLLGKIRETEALSQLPVIVLTGLTDEKDETLGLQMGANDFIHKPFRPEAVKVRISNQLKIASQQRNLEALAVRDHLTGLYNRRGFDEIFSRELARAKRSGAPLSLAMVDVDYFKRYNDYYGHPQGDAALRFIAQHLNAVTRRAADLCARVGGEEFLLLWPETPAKGALHQAEKLRRTIEQDAFEHLGSAISKTLTVSIGGITLEAGNYNPQVALDRVDAVLYGAKRAGRNRVVWDRLN